MKVLTHNEGFTIIETIIGMGVFLIVSTSLYLAYSSTLDIVNSGHFNSTALTLAEDEIEVIRAMKYEDIGTQGGSPPGKLPSSKTVTLDGTPFTVNTTIRNVDDPFDGTVGGTPNDLSPADYKLAEIEITCSGCQKFLSVRVTTSVSPRALESATNNGSLFINVLNANGQPVSGANVLVVNNAVTPPINVSDTTGATGQLQFVNIATSSGGYQVTVSKTGYSGSQTYAPGNPPNPLQPHATVAKQQLTTATFAIDQVSTLNFKTQDELCAGVPNVDYIQKGTKLIGTGPNTLKYSVQHVTDSGGNKSITNLEWDTYTFTNLDADVDISGTTVPVSLIVNPNSSYSATWNTAPKNPNSLLVRVQNSSGQPLSDANVQLTKTGFDQTKVTGRRTITNTDWSGTQFQEKSANIEIANPAGEIRLVDLGGGTYASTSDEWLMSKTIDFGTSAVFYTMSFNPTSQPPQSGPNALRIQVAANNDNTTWSYTGPDGTSNTYYTVPAGSTLHNSLNNNRYLRYKVYLRTDDDQFTPSLRDITFTYSSSCFPAEQSFFTGLTADTYTLTITKSGYQTFTSTNVSVASGWQLYQATLTPQ